MRKYFLPLIVILLTLSIAFAQENQTLNKSKAAGLNYSNSSGFKHFYDIESFAKIKPVYDTSMLSRSQEPFFNVSQRGGQPARFVYAVGIAKQNFNVSQRAGQLARFIYPVGIVKPIYNVSAYSRMRSIYDI
ncbi:MAG: hypothetical protein MUO26_03350 [Methanotrichaceae archaeon]|nr:hypothetical protein [Methanotrichaceae archaeon]